MRQPHITTIGIKHNEKAEKKRIKTIQTQSKNIIHPHMHKHINLIYLIYSYKDRTINDFLCKSVQ